MRRSPVPFLSLLLATLAWPPLVAGQDAAPAAQDLSRYALSADPGNPLAGISSVRLQVAMSAPEAGDCQVAQADLEAAATTPIRDAPLTIVDSANLDARAAAAAPEFFVALTIIRDESGVCAGSLLTQFGVDTNVVLLHRNVESAPGTLKLSSGYVELGRQATLLVGVMPTFGEQVIAAVGQQVATLARRVADAGAAAR